MKFIDFIANEKLTVQKIEMAVAKVFDIGPTKVMAYESDDNWDRYNNEIQILCAVYEATGDFSTAVEMELLKPFQDQDGLNTLKIVDALCTDLKCEALTFEEGRPVTQAAIYLLAKGNNHFEKVLVDDHLQSDRIYKIVEYLDSDKNE